MITMSKLPVKRPEKFEVWRRRTVRVKCECGRHFILKKRDRWLGPFADWEALFAKVRITRGTKIRSWYDRSMKRRVIQVLIGF